MIIPNSSSTTQFHAEYLKLDQLRTSPAYSYDGNILIDLSGRPKGQILIDIPWFNLQAGILFYKLFCIKMASLLAQKFEGIFTTSLDMSSISCLREEKSNNDVGIIIPNKFNAFHLNNMQFRSDTFQALFLIHESFLDLDFLQKIEDTFHDMLKQVKIESISTFKR